MTRAILPLRWSLPLFMVAVGVVGGVLAAVVDIRGARAGVVADLTSRAQVLGTSVGGAIESSLRAGRPTDARGAVLGLVVDRDLTLSALIDDAGRIQFATVFRLVGAHSDSLGSLPIPLRGATGESTRGVSREAGHLLVGRFPVLLEPREGELMPSRHGLLVLVYDLAGPLRAATVVGMRQGALMLGAALALALLAGLTFRYWITRRVEHLVAATRAMASGDYRAPRAIAGRDELAQVAEALGNLGEELAAKASLEDQLRQSQKMEAFGQFAGGVAHDFNNILAAITGHVALLIEETPPSDPRTRDLREIERSAGRAADLTRQLLTFSRRDVTRADLVDICKTVRGVETMLRRLLGNGVRLDLDLPDGLGTIRIDRGQLEQVLVNLALNARDAMSEAGTLAIAVREVEPLQDWPDELPSGRYLHVTVADSGPGIDAAVAGRIFEPFFTTKPHGKGTGLGLSTVHGILRQAGGAIRVGRSDETGAVLEFVLPWAGPAASAQNSGEHARPPAGRGEVVLVIDDEPAVLDVFGRILVRGGYSPLLAADASAAEALARENRRHVNLLISDVLMPEVDGVRLVGRLREVVGEVPALFVSGYTDAHTEALTLLQPGDAFLLKPVRAEDLLHQVHAMLQPTEVTEGDSAG